MKGLPRTLLSLCLLLAATGLASANGLPLAALPGKAGGALQPAGQTGIAVLRERLALDLREAPGRITAVYEMENRGSGPERVTVAFLVPGTPNIDSPPVVMLDGRALPVEPEKQPLLLAEGETQMSPDWLDPFTGEPYRPGGRTRRHTEPGDAWFFPLALEAGQRARLEVSYRQAPGEDYTRFVAPSLRYDYLLQPARHWAGFGSLEVEVRTPPGRRLQANLPLTRASADRYTGSFVGLPEGNLSLFIAPGAGSGGLASRWWQRAFRPWIILTLTFALAFTTGLAGRLSGPAWQPRLALVRWITPVLAVALSPLHQFHPGPQSLITTFLLYYPALLATFLIGGWLLPWLLTRHRT